MISLVAKDDLDILIDKLLTKANLRYNNSAKTKLFSNFISLLNQFDPSLIIMITGFSVEKQRVVFYDEQTIVLCKYFKKTFRIYGVNGTIYQYHISDFQNFTNKINQLLNDIASN